MATPTKLLFILKRKEVKNPNDNEIYVGMSTGLYNSVSFIHGMIAEMDDIVSDMVVVGDNNDIDREVNKHKPDYVIIEALWVVPSKFEVLCKLHPKVKWIIRLHSELPFIAGEGIAMDWIGEYSKFDNLIVACNAPRMHNDIKFYLRYLNSWTDKITDERVIYLPNYYPPESLKKKTNEKFAQMKQHSSINVGCFGAVRPLKNHLNQAMSAIKFANKIGKKLNFHINADRIEMQGQPALHNLIGLFKHFADKGHQLICHDWCDHSEFLVLCELMDIGMQVSLTETFNIVGADLLSQGVPIIGSSEIPWLKDKACASPVDTEDIAGLMAKIYKSPDYYVTMCQDKLKSYVKLTQNCWQLQFGKKISKTGICK